MHAAPSDRGRPSGEPTRLDWITAIEGDSSWLREAAEAVFEPVLRALDPPQGPADSGESDIQRTTLLAPAEQRMLELMYEVFEPTGKWPTFQYLSGRPLHNKSRCGCAARRSASEVASCRPRSLECRSRRDRKEQERLARAVQATSGATVASLKGRGCGPRSSPRRSYRADRAILAARRATRPSLHRHDQPGCSWNSNGMIQDTDRPGCRCGPQKAVSDPGARAAGRERPGRQTTADKRRCRARLERSPQRRTRSLATRRSMPGRRGGLGG